MSGWVALILIVAVWFSLNAIVRLGAGDFGWGLFDVAAAIAAWLMFLSDPRRV